MGFKIEENNIDKVLDELNEKVSAGLETIGIKAEKYAKALCPVGTVASTGKKGYRGGTLRNSITHEVDEDNCTVTIGSNVEYAPFVELGTGPNFTPPPEWEDFEPVPSKGVGTGYVRPRPYLRPAIEDHIKTYEEILKSTLS